ncbi:Amidase [Allomuricauda ruestringensis DSM 13258]|uniref:Amidase n=1 Tax=Allomuricauda ruestringensis (strain DSM 13258 / CIP 107369 / LMG 19739 / B1) TaxID=886377 RepID=G2PMT6_ALLRU|nr:amidase family protein [Allomuricauda ruestringensis]AEM71248.1 Amidase [Allomuricauda ruestringensis DSM 13258]
MLRYFLCAFLLIGFTSCKDKNAEPREEVVLWTPYNDSAEVAANAEHENKRMRYKFIQSKVLDKNAVFLPLYDEVSQFTEAQYERMKPLVLEQDIPTIQNHIDEGTFTYEDLVLFYLHRIYTYELPNTTTLNTVIALNPNVLEEARQLDESKEAHHPIYGMPILLKDNIGTAEMKTTAGAIALKENQTDDAFIVKRLKQKGALILGKVNLSEWANFLCDGCPNGQSAIGGQTLNPYGRRVFDTGGSSAGSGTSTAANYAVGAVGTETSGSILSPSSQSSVVGLKPTIGLLSRTGIVPISSTLDTPGPMTKNVTDNAILLDAMLGEDEADYKSVSAEPGILSAWMNPEPLQQIRLGVMTSLVERDSIYAANVEALREAGAQIVEFESENIPLEGFTTLLNLDMEQDLTAYLNAEVKDRDAVKVESVEDVVTFNNKDSLVRIPYGQARFDGILADSTTSAQFEKIKKDLKASGRAFFNIMEEEQLDAVLSINNYHAGYAAVAEYPALTVPMGYKTDGEPESLTFIGKPFSEAHLLRIGKAFEALTKARKIPEGYQE